MINPKTRIAALVMTIAFALGGCSLFKSSSAPSDGAIVSSIQSKLYQDPALKTRDVRVVSQKGVVVLSGTVDSDQEKAAAEQLAQSTDGVKQVINELEVNPSQENASNSSGAAAQSQHRASRHRSRSVAENEPAPETPTPSQRSASQAPAPVVQAPPPSEQAPPPPPQPVSVTIPAGTVIPIRTVDPIDSTTSQVGDEFAATIDAPIQADGQVVIPRNSNARLKLVTERNAGHIKGRSEVQLQLVSLTAGGKTYAVNSGIYQQAAASSRGKQTAKRVGIGAALGAAIGAIAGGGKGAAIGAGVGAGAGTGVQMATKGQAVKIPSETRINFTLSSPLRITVSQ